MNNLNEYELNPEVLGESAEFELEGEMVNEMMEVSNELELESFLSKVWDGAKKFYNAPEGQAIKKDFIAGAKSFGKQMLPSIGQNVGQYLGGKVGPITKKVSGFAGQRIGSAVGNFLFGEMPQSEAVDYVRVIRKAARYLNRALAKGGAALSVPPRVLVTKAINTAAQPVVSQRRYGRATGIATSNYPIQKQGQWIRRGNSLVLQGAAN